MSALRLGTPFFSLLSLSLSLPRSITPSSSSPLSSSSSFSSPSTVYSFPSRESAFDRPEFFSSFESGVLRAISRLVAGWSSPRKTSRKIVRSICLRSSGPKRTSRSERDAHISRNGAREREAEVPTERIREIGGKRERERKRERGRGRERESEGEWSLVLAGGRWEGFEEAWPRVERRRWRVEGGKHK